MADIEDIGKGPRKRSDRKRSKEKAEETNSANTEETSQGSSWRDFITNASAALEGLADDTTPVEATTNEAQASADTDATESKLAKKNRTKKSKVDEIEWKTETKDLEIVEGSATEAASDTPVDENGLANDSSETVSRFEELARRVAASAADLQNTFNGNDVVTEPTALGDDSGEAPTELEPLAAAEATFDIEESAVPDEATIEARGDVVPETNTEEEVNAADAAIDFQLTPDTTFEEGAEQLGFASDAQAEVTTNEIVENSGEASDDGSLDAASDDSSENETDEPAEFIATDTLMSVIESLLFSTDKPVSLATIKQIFKGSNVRTKDIHLAIESLMAEFASPSRGVTLEEVNGGYQLRTKSDNADYLRRLAKVRPFRLSGPALEVMAIVAYKQPITKHEIDEIRGVESGHLLRALMERSLVSFGGKSDLPGKPMTYNSTRQFLETFGLRNLKELPTLSEIDEILPEGIGDVEEKETLSDLTDRMSTSIGSTYSEGEDELEKINEQLQQVDTTSEFFEQEKVRERERRDRERAQDIREKLVLGDSVEEKDRRWLDRYEAKLASGTQASEAAAAVDETVQVNHAPEANTPLEPALQDEPGQITEDLETLTAESTPMAAADEADDLEAEDASWMKESDDSDDLIGNEDWNEDDESTGGRGH